MINTLNNNTSWNICKKSLYLIPSKDTDIEDGHKEMRNDSNVGSLLWLGLGGRPVKSIQNVLPKRREETICHLKMKSHLKHNPQNTISNQWMKSSCTEPPACCRWYRVWWLTGPGSGGTSWHNPRSASWSNKAPWLNLSADHTPEQAAWTESHWQTNTIKHTQ